MTSTEFNLHDIRARHCRGAGLKDTHGARNQLHELGIRLGGIFG